MNYQKQYADKINWKNSPDTSTPLNATNLNKMDNALWYMDGALYTISKAIGGGSSARGGIISNVGNNVFTTHIHQRTGESLANNELLILRSDVSGTGNSINVYTNSSSAVGFGLLDLDGESTSITVTTDSVVVLMITDADTDYTAQVLAVIDTAGGVAYSGLGIGKKTGVSSNVIDTDIDLHRSPMAGDRLLVYFDETVQNPTGLKTYNNGVAVTSNLENATPLYINAGWNILEFKNDGLLYNNVWVRKQNIPVPSTLAGMSDTLIVSPSDDQLLVYDNGKWKNKKFVEANVGFSDTELKKIKVGDIVYDTDGLRDYSVTNIANNNITISVLNSNQFVMENIAINTGNHSGSSNGWNLVISDGLNPVSVALKNADGSPFADDIHENELLFVYVDTAGNVARVLEIHSHDLEILKDAIITEKTVSGNPIVITDALPYPAVSLSAEIEASQDLHGYDKPWVGGANGNLFGGGAWTDKNCSYVYTEATGELVITVSSSASQVLYTISDVSSLIGETVTFSITAHNSSKNSAKPYVAIYKNLTTMVGNLGSAGQGIVNNSVSFVIPNDTESLSFLFRTDQNEQDVSGDIFTVTGIQFEIGSSVSSFRPYSNICPISGRTSVTITDVDAESQTATVTIQLGQTVYGGTLNLITGVLTIKWVICLGGDLSWVVDDVTGKGQFRSRFDGPAYSTAEVTVISSNYKGMPALHYSALNDGEVSITNSADSPILRVRDDRYLGKTAQEFKTAISTVQFCYKLATPTTVQLTPTDLQMLKGYNRLSSDGGGDITLTYKADRLAAIEAALAAL